MSTGPIGPVVVGVVGASGSGKTTLVERLVPVLAARGHRVATAKHAPHGFVLDRSGSDSARHLAAGAEVVLLVGPSQVVAQRRGTAPLADLVGEHGGPATLVLAEGFSRAPGPKVLVHRRGVPVRWPPAPEEVIVAVTDEPLGHAHEIPPDDLDAIADAVADAVADITPDRAAPDVELRIDGTAVPTSEFVRRIITSTVLGMVSALKDVPDRPATIELVVRSR